MIPAAALRRGAGYREAAQMLKAMAETATRAGDGHTA
jgi:hypothetical protein